MNRRRFQLLAILLVALFCGATRQERYARNQVLAPQGRGGYYGFTYGLKDEFTTDVAAGFSAPRNCEPGPGQVIAITDTTSEVSIASGKLSFAGTGSSSYTDSRVTLTGQSRVAGKVLLFKVTPGNTSGLHVLGWSAANPATTTNCETVFFNTSGQLFSLTAGALQIGTYTAVENEFAIVLRATGHTVLRRVTGGRWTVAYTHNLLTTATVYPSVQRRSTNATTTVDDVRVLTTLWQCPVLASDSFDRANGALGSTDGAGTEEPGGSGFAWSTLQGTCAIASNVAAFSARDGTSGVGLAAVDCGQADGVWEATLTTGAAAGGRPGVAFRVTDASNYWVAYLDNSANLIRIDEVVAGSVTNRASVAATVADSTSYRMLVIADGTSIQAYHNNTTRAAYASAATGLSATKFGPWTDTAVDVTFNNVSAKPRYADSFNSLAP